MDLFSLSSSKRGDLDNRRTQKLHFGSILGWEVHCVVEIWSVKVFPKQLQLYQGENETFSGFETIFVAFPPGAILRLKRTSIQRSRYVLWGVLRAKTPIHGAVLINNLNDKFVFLVTQFIRGDLRNQPCLFVRDFVENCPLHFLIFLHEVIGLEIVQSFFWGKLQLRPQSPKRGQKSPKKPQNGQK